MICGYPANLNAAKYAYTIAKEYCDTHVIKIYNAPRSGKLEVFERVDFNELIKKLMEVVHWQLHYIN